jgi:hypothetical protein
MSPPAWLDDPVAVRQADHVRRSAEGLGLREPLARRPVSHVHPAAAHQQHLVAGHADGAGRGDVVGIGAGQGGDLAVAPSTLR